MGLGKEMGIATIAALIMVIVATVVGFGAVKIFGEHDSAVEEIAEEIVEHHTGVDVDFTPGSKEE